MAGGYTRKSAIRGADDEKERSLKQENIKRVETKNRFQQNQKRQLLTKKSFPRNVSACAKRHKTSSITESEETEPKVNACAKRHKTSSIPEVNDELDSCSSSHSTFQDKDIGQEHKHSLSSNVEKENATIHLENINTVTKESQQKNNQLSSRNTADRERDDVSGLTSFTASSVSFKENENIYFTAEIAARWGAQKKVLRIALVNIVKQPKWFGRFKFASDRICAHIVNDSLKNKTIACTQGLNVYQFTCVVTKKLLYSVFNRMRQRKIHE